MTIYVQWKWIAKTETFLMILHMDADFSDRSRNLRIAPKLFLSAKDVKNTPLGIGRHDFFYFSEDMKGRLMSEAFEEDFDRTRLKSRSIITWAPTHVETGVLAELLCYANIINGFKKEKRHSLRAYLELWASKEDREFWYKIYEVVTKDGPEGLKGYMDELKKRKNGDTYQKKAENKKLLRKILEKRLLLFGKERGFSSNTELEDVFCIELCPEYIEYIKKVIDL